MLRKLSAGPALIGLLIAVSLIFGGQAVAAPTAQATPTMEHAMGDDHDSHEAEDEHAHGDRIDPGDASIRIVSPADGAMISQSSALIRVETTNYPLGEGKHWHLYVDGKERGMSQGNSDTMEAADLEPGEHTIEVVLSNEQHQELDAAHLITIRVEAAAAAPETAAADNTPLIVLGVVGAAIAVAGVGFIIARRK